MEAWRSPFEAIEDRNGVTGRPVAVSITRGGRPTRRPRIATPRTMPPAARPPPVAVALKATEDRNPCAARSSYTMEAWRSPFEAIEDRNFAGACTWPSSCCRWGSSSRAIEDRNGSVWENSSGPGVAVALRGDRGSQLPEPELHRHPHHPVAVALRVKGGHEEGQLRQRALQAGRFDEASPAGAAVELSGEVNGSRQSSVCAAVSECPLPCFLLKAAPARPTAGLKRVVARYGFWYGRGLLRRESAGDALPYQPEGHLQAADHREGRPCCYSTADDGWFSDGHVGDDAGEAADHEKCPGQDSAAPPAPRISKQSHRSAEHHPVDAQRQ